MKTMMRKIAMMTAVVLALQVSTAEGQSIRVAVWGEDDTRINDVISKTMAVGLFETVDMVNIETQGVPTLEEALAYDSILIFGGHNSFSPETSEAAGNVLADYADVGKGVVTATFVLHSGSTWMLQGRFNNERYHVMVPYGSQVEGRQTLGTRYQPDHPLLEGVVSFDGGSSSYRIPVTQLTPESTLIADWSSGMPFLAVKELSDMGRRVDLNFYPPSSDVRSDFWDVTTDGDVLMSNALYWAAIPEPATLSLLAVGALALIRRWRK